MDVGGRSRQEEVSLDPSKDPNRKAKSKDPGWKYGFWLDLTNKDLVQCTLCGKQMHSDIKRLKQHLAAGFGDAQKCPKTTATIMREMQDSLKKSARTSNVYIYDEEEGQDEEAQEFEDEVTPSHKQQPQHYQRHSIQRSKFLGLRDYVGIYWTIWPWVQASYLS
jgi:hypothetical protein